MQTSYKVENSILSLIVCGHDGVHESWLFCISLIRYAYTVCASCGLYLNPYQTDKNRREME